MSLLFYPLFSPLQVAQYVSGNHVPIFRSWRLNSFSPRVGIVAAGRLSEPVSRWCVHWGTVLRTPQWTHYLLTGSDSLPAATAQYKHVAKHYAVVSFWRWAHGCPKHVEQLVKEKIKVNTKLTSSWFLIHTELRCTVNHTSDLTFWRRNYFFNFSTSCI